MSLVALGPLIQVSGRASPASGRSRATASGTSCTTWSACTTHTWVSGTRVSARRPWSSRWSSTIVPVTAMPRAAAVTTASVASSPAWVGVSVSDRTSATPATASTHSGSRPVGSSALRQPWSRRAVAMAAGSPAAGTRTTSAR